MMTDLNEEWKTKTRKCFTKIKPSLDPKGHVLDKLFEQGIIPAKELKEMSDGPDQETRAGRVLLHLFQTAHTQAFVVFREALKRDYNWIVEMIDGYKDSKLAITTDFDLNEELKINTRKCFTKVKPSFDPKGHVLDTLFENGIITARELHDINGGPDTETRAGNVLSHLFQTTHQQAFLVFREALMKDYDWIVEIIHGGDMTTHSSSDSAEGNLGNARSNDVSSNSSPMEVVFSSVEVATSQVPGSNSKSLVIVEFSKLVIEKMIGAGAYGEVHKAEHPDFPGTPLAYKRINAVFIQPRDEAELKGEARIHMRLDHPNIVKCFAVVYEPKNYGMILEFVKYGEARNYLMDNNYLRSKLKVIKEVASGMKYLHSIKPHAVIHGDLKSENVLIGEDEMAKICDFGFSRWKEYSKSHSTQAVPLGTVTHVPPERWRDCNLRKNEMFDVYSFGITMWEILMLESPYPGVPLAQIRICVENGQRPDLGDIPTGVAKHVVDLMIECWDGDKLRRPSFEDILAKLEMEQ